MFLLRSQLPPSRQTSQSSDQIFGRFNSIEYESNFKRSVKLNKRVNLERTKSPRGAITYRVVCWNSFPRTLISVGEIISRSPETFSLFSPDKVSHPRWSTMNPRKRYVRRVEHLKIMLLVTAGYL